ncbi:MAG: lipid-A-disaccharide synthase [Candidatus Krumholzibacteria bacterium]|nr:lipid-A-disaccharide synthase [Candidatus Krumholzibacteria bacterium]MDP6796428.1 lipid-A-disaccharide synthase [Candidatus Krumholzibacteria bacterium]
MPEERRILLLAGEASGDQATAPLIREILRQHPRWKLDAIGGPAMKEAGAQILYSSEELAVMGFQEVLLRAPRLLSLRRKMAERIRSGTYDLFLPVDAPAFNLPLCRIARQSGVPALYFIAPQVWAWKENRLKSMKRDLSALAVILPFEEDWFRERGMEARFVGHPLASHWNPGPRDREPVGQALRIALLPGSRKQEIRRHLPLFLKAAEKLSQRREDCSFHLLEASSLSPLLYETALKSSTLTVHRHRTGSREFLQDMDAAWVSSGTATLETALAGLPMVVVYRTGALSYFLASRLVKLDSISLVNLLAEEKLVPERVQGDASPENLLADMESLLDLPDAASRQREGFRLIAEGLGGRDPAQEVASMVLRLLEES